MLEEALAASKLTAIAEGVLPQWDEKNEVPEESKVNNMFGGAEVPRSNEDRLIMYFHGNAEDLFHNIGFL